MGFELKKIDYSKLKGKSVAVVYDEFDGLRFIETLKNLIEVDVETYRVDELSFYKVDSMIKKLNGDPRVALIVNISSETIEALVSPEKRFVCIRFPKGEVSCSVSRMELEKKFNLINIAGIVKRLGEKI